MSFFSYGTCITTNGALFAAPASLELPHIFFAQPACLGGRFYDGNFPVLRRVSDHHRGPNARHARLRGTGQMKKSFKRILSRIE